MRLSADDIGLWRRAMRDVVPLRERAGAPDAKGERPFSERGHPARPAVDANGTPAVRTRPLLSPPLPPLDAFAGLDRAQRRAA